MAAASEMDEIKPDGAAAAKVFSTFELLENVLVKLANIDIRRPVIDRAKRIRDLYRFQRVNSTFRDLIAQSKALQLLMFKIQREEEHEEQPSSHPEEHTSEMKRLLNLNPLLSTLPWFGLPLRQNGDVFRDLGVLEGDIHYLRGDLVTKGSSIKDLKAWKSLSVQWRQMVVASKPTAFKVVLLPETYDYMRTRGQWYIPPHGAFELEKGDTLGRFVDLVIEEIVNCVESEDILD